ncbi:MAG: phospholipid/cholesterol/gamma-HCH transport system substrate-binding protein [Solirubrobacteraceae bacterium]|nr:phospholipid/cholesterol/gamma-HCH transport system substrate-binding protein [Solirubrobacteraceae bacterium]
MRRHRGSVIANPVLVGAVTLLVVNVATVLAWFANRGLPFVPTQEVKIELPNGANLLPGNEVREGGFRIGIVSDMDAVMLRGGRVGAVATLKIDAKQKGVPVDSRIVIRPRSVLGLKYVELHRGDAERDLREGDTLPVSRASIPVELDEFQNMFDDFTRTGIQRNLGGFGIAFASRGASLNRTISEAPRFLGHLEPVMHVLADRDTQIGRFFSELEDFTSTVAPVADRYAHGFTAGADTFEAWSRHPRELGATIEKSAPTMDAGIRSLRVQRPFLEALRDTSIALEAAARELPRTLPRITPALRAGIPVLRRSPEVNAELRDTLDSLNGLMRDPATGVAFRGLGDTTSILNPAVRFLGPYITVCNYFNYSFTHLAEHLTEADQTGYSQRTLLNQAGQQVDLTNHSRTGVTTLGAAHPANGGEGSGAHQFLHSNNYSAAISRTGEADCESGQRGYVERLNVFNPDPDVKTVVDPHLPGNSGPTRTGLARVPRGQTFSRAPEIGPTLRPELDP